MAQGLHIVIDDHRERFSDVPIVTVTDMVANLAVVSMSTWVLRDLEVLEEWLSQLPSL